MGSARPGFRIGVNDGRAYLHVVLVVRTTERPYCTRLDGDLSEVLGNGMARLWFSGTLGTG